MEKTGLACYHIWKVIFELRRDSVFKGIEKQWLIPEDLIVSKIVQTQYQGISVKRGPSKESRRNMLS